MTGDLILATSGIGGEVYKLILNGGKLWVEGFPFSETQRRIALEEAMRARNVPMPAWIKLAYLMLIAMATFYVAALQGCSARFVNGNIANLSIAIAVQDLPGMLSRIAALANCLLEGLNRGPIAFIEQDFLSQYTGQGTIIERRVIPTASSVGGAGSLASGVFAADDTNLKVFGPDLELIGTVPLVGTFLSTGTVSVSQEDFYVARVHFTGTVYENLITRVSADAVVLASWTLPELPVPETSFIRGFGVSWDGQTIYYSSGFEFLYAFDVQSETSSEFATDPTLGAYGVIGVANGQIVSLWQTGGAVELRVYDADGTKRQTVRFDGVGTLGWITRAKDDTTVWLWLGTQVYEVRLIDGAIMTSFTVVAGNTTPGNGTVLFVPQQPLT